MLVSIDRDRLVELAAAADCVVHVVPAIGSSCPGLTTPAHRGRHRQLDREAAARCIGSGLERTLDEDVAYGFRMLVDMAERALSDSPFLDPTTAVQASTVYTTDCVNWCGAIPRTGASTTASGRLRLTVPVMDWDAYVHLAFDEIRIAGTRSPQVTRRLMAAFDDLLEIAPPARRHAIEEQFKLLCASWDENTGGGGGPGSP